MRMWTAALALLAACSSSGETVTDAGPDAAIAPPCPLDGGRDLGDVALCGGGCTRVHEDGECTPGYVCTCSGACIWVSVFPPDARIGCMQDASVLYAGQGEPLDAARARRR